MKDGGFDGQFVFLLVVLFGALIVVIALIHNTPGGLF